MTDALKRLHDGYIDGVMLDEKSDAVTFYCRYVDGSGVRVYLTGIVDLCVNNLRECNIVLLIRVFEEIEEIGQRMIFALAQTEDEAGVQRYLERLRTTAVSLKRKYFLLQGSYGADAVCVFTGELKVDPQG